MLRVSLPFLFTASLATAATAPPPYPGPGYGYAPPPAYAPTPPPPPPPSPCCSWSVRVDPFDLIFRRVTLEGEYRVLGPVSIEVIPQYIFGTVFENQDEIGFSITGGARVYLEGGTGMEGWWLSGRFGYESFEATVTHPADTSATLSRDLASPFAGMMIGTSTIFGRNGGFVISGGVGVGIYFAGKEELTVRSTADGTDAPFTYYTGLNKIRPEGSFAIGAAF